MLEQRQVLSGQLALELVDEAGVGLGLVKLDAEVVVDEDSVLLLLLCLGQLLPDAPELIDQVI